MLAFVAHDIRNASEISFMFRDDKGTRVEGHDHPGGIDIAALIVVAACVLSSRDSYVRRIIALTVLNPVCARYKNRVIRVIQSRCVPVTTGDVEKLCKTIVNCA